LKRGRAAEKFEWLILTPKDRKTPRPIAANRRASGDASRTAKT
jgi:hypothetical protein